MAYILGNQKPEKTNIFDSVQLNPLLKSVPLNHRYYSVIYNIACSTSFHNNMVVGNLLNLEHLLIILQSKHIFVFFKLNRNKAHHFTSKHSQLSERNQLRMWFGAKPSFSAIAN